MITAHEVIELENDNAEQAKEIIHQKKLVTQQAEAIEETPFFAGSDGSDSDISDDSNDDDEEDGAVGGSKEPVDEEDELIKALKAAREKKTRNCPPDIKTQV